MPDEKVLIENYLSLKKYLEEGHDFLSEKDFLSLSKDLEKLKESLLQISQGAETQKRTEVLKCCLISISKFISNSIVDIGVDQNILQTYGLAMKISSYLDLALEGVDCENIELSGNGIPVNKELLIDLIEGEIKKLTDNPPRNFIELYSQKQKFIIDLPIKYTRR